MKILIKSKARRNAYNIDRGNTQESSVASNWSLWGIPFDGIAPRFDFRPHFYCSIQFRFFALATATETVNEPLLPTNCIISRFLIECLVSHSDTDGQNLTGFFYNNDRVVPNRLHDQLFFNPAPCAVLVIDTTQKINRVWIFPVIANRRKMETSVDIKTAN